MIPDDIQLVLMEESVGVRYTGPEPLSCPGCIPAAVRFVSRENWRERNNFSATFGVHPALRSIPLQRHFSFDVTRQTERTAVCSVSREK